MTAQRNAGHAAFEKGDLDRVAEQLRQPSRDAGDKYREEERGQPCEQEIDQGGLEHLFERCVDNAGGEIEQRRHRGRDVAHAEVNGKDRRKMHGAEAELFDDGNKDRRGEQTAARVVHEHAEDDHKQVYHEHYAPAVVSHGIERVEDQLGQVDVDKHAREHLNGQRQEHDGTGGLRSVDEAVFELSICQLFVDKEANGDRVSGGNGRGLSGRGDAAVYAAEDNDRHEQGKEGAVLIVELAQPLFLFISRLDLFRGQSFDVIVVAQHEQRADRQQDREDYAGNRACEEAGKNGGGA